MEEKEEEEVRKEGVREGDGVEVCCLAVQIHCDQPPPDLFVLLAVCVWRVNRL